MELMNFSAIKKIQVLLAALMTVVLLLLPISAKQAQAQSPWPSDDDVNRIAEQLFCPVCENVPLDECQTQACEQWRELIRQKLGEGWRDDEIKAFFVAQYGDRVLGEPPRRGAHWLLYVLPWVVFVLGIGLIIRLLRRGRAPAPMEEPVKEDLYLKKVEQDLKRLEHEP